MQNRRDFLLLFVGCSLARPTLASVQSGTPSRRQVSVGGRRVKTVDVHCHVTMPDAWDLIKDDPTAVNAQVGVTDPASPKGPQLDPRNVSRRLAEMDQQGIDVQALGINPFWYRTDRDVASRIIQLQNERLADLCGSYPDRFAALASVALQHPDLAVKQLEDAVKKLGMRGAMIGGSVNGEELSAPKFHPFWSKAEELNVLIFIHPQGFPDGQRRFQGNGTLGNVIGNPLETTVALSHLIFEGTLDRFPGLKICGAHGGGFLASYIGRSDHCVQFNGDFPAACTPLKKRPSEYLKQLYFDSIVFTGEGLRHLVAEAGASQIVLGTDYPYGMGDPAAVDHILHTPGLKDEERIAMLGGNAARLLGIK
jgi:aminocarboxymuconate-semialdehyde decarboxylase